MNTFGRNLMRAFTLVELIVVMAIMTVLGLIAALAIHNVQDHAKIEETKSIIKQIETALEQYRQDIGHYPRGTGDGLQALLTLPASGWKGATFGWFHERPDLKDSWGMVIQYCGCADYWGGGLDVGRGVERTPKKGDYYNTGRYQIYSYGPNMKTFPNTKSTSGHPRLGGTEPDDIRNWNHEKFYLPAAYN